MILTAKKVFSALFTQNKYCVHNSAKWDIKMKQKLWKSVKQEIRI